MKNAITKGVLIVSLVMFVNLLLSMGCTQDTSTIVPKTVSPRGGVEVTWSFPSGAPRLNQTVELKCTLTAFSSAKIFSAKISLPEGFELVSGNLSWSGDLLMNNKIDIVSTIKAVKTGNWTIAINRTIGPENSWRYAEGQDREEVYIAVHELSAEWGIYPPWKPKVGNPTPIVPVTPK